jgi:hypothetical protein
VAFSEKSLDDYVDVAQRIADFRALYPSGSLQPADPAAPFTLKQLEGWEKSGDCVTQTFVVVVAAAYRTPDDGRPGIGMAWEIFPGRTPYTRGSELMNAETSAWGRAIVAVLASDSKRGVASRQEIEARQAEQQEPPARVRVTGAEHERLRNGTVEPTPHDRPADRQGLVDNPPVDKWMLPAPEEKPGSISEAQSKRMHQLFRAAQIIDRAERLKITEQVTGRQVQTSAQLSMIEADALIRHLEDQAKEAAK